LHETECKAFSYVSGWNRCFLKSKFTQEIPLKIYSGTYNGEVTKLPEGYNIDYPPGDFLRLENIMTPLECKNRCLLNEKCKAFSYLDAYKSCFLKNKLSAKQDKIFSCGKKSNWDLGKSFTW